MSDSKCSEKLEQPPLFTSWNTWYYLVLGFMLFQVLLFTIITNSFS